MKTDHKPMPQPVNSALSGMSVVFMWENYPLTENGVGGASPLAYSHLEALVYARCAVHLVQLLTKAGIGDVRENPTSANVYGKVADQVASYTPLDGQQAQVRQGRGARHWQALRDPVAYEAATYPSFFRTALQQVVKQHQPQLIWAEHLQPAALAVTAKLGVPICYSHHDWKWKIKQLRAQTQPTNLKERLHYRAVKRAEETLLQRVDRVVTGSATEAESLRLLRKDGVRYFPITYHPVALPDPVVHDPPRIVHLGGMGTTASRQGLLRFLEVVWPQLEAALQPKPALWVVGKTAGIPADFKERLVKAGAVCTGFVSDLSSVLRPYDLHIIPWEYDTGVRTRMPVAMNYAQVLLATRAAVAGLPEARHEENCMLADRLEEMGPHLLRVYKDSALRKRLGDQARATFEQSYTQPAVQPSFDQFLEALVQLPREKRGS